MTRKKVVLGVGVPSWGSCFLGKAWAEKKVVLGVGVHSWGSGFLAKPWPEKRRGAWVWRS